MTNKDLTKVQRITLKYLENGYSVGTIAKKRKVSRAAVYKTIRILDKKGYLKYGGKNWGGTNTLRKPIRLHALQYQIKILYSSPVYYRLLKNNNMLIFNDFKVRIYKDSLSLWILRDFTDNNIALCRSAAKDYLGATLRFLERKLSITLLKRGYKNIKLVKSHYARVGDETAKKTNEEGSRIMFKDPLDKKPWLITDQSLKVDELETVHPKTAYTDMADVIEPFYTMLRDNPNILIDLQKYNRDLAKSQLITQNQILALSKLFTGLFGAGSSKDNPSDSAHDPEDPPDYVG